jgi:DNA helicase-2/ATP-dependent DNA helicase PcrA
MARTFVLKGRSSGRLAELERDLNPEQFAAATCPGGPALVIAGAGTGKTRTLIYRLATLMASGVDPGRLLLVTFTHRAAREMLQRVRTLVPGDADRVWGGTFHHVAHRLLRRYGAAIDWAGDFTLLDREDARDLMAWCVAESGLSVTRRRFPQKAVLAEIWSAGQNTLQPLDAVLRRRYPMFAAEQDDLERVFALYTATKRVRHLVDYDDLLSGLLALLARHGPVRDELGDRFLHILVDEVQDTNAAQGAILDALAARHRNLFVVGDDAQAIYGFRGAHDENMLGFKARYPDAREYRLETNYRSTPEILALANASIGRNRRRLPKTLRAARAGGMRPCRVACHDHFVQCRFIAEYILHLLEQGRALTDIAVLYRSHWHSPEIQLELKRRNIPYQVRGGLRFFEQAHIKDALAFLRILHNPRDELAWHRLLKLLPGIGGALARRFWRHIAATAQPLEAAATEEAHRLAPASARPGLAQFVELLQAARPLQQPGRMLEYILSAFYDDALTSHYDSAELRRQDVRGLADFAAPYHELDAFLADVALSGEFSSETIVRGPEEDKFVTLSTVHQAKGLEWPIVFIPWLADGRFPTDFMLNRPEDEEEERRLFHVAVTRAKDELFLISPQIFRRGADATILMKPSRFLTELDEALTEPMILDEGLSPLTVGESPAVLAPA